jgi:tetratricopeptide (TPR) repeat protein
VSLDGPRSTNATWHAADAYDSAGRRKHAADVLETFLRERPASVRAPEALLRLGQTYQAAGEFRNAIEKYQTNLINHPSVPFAIRSIVPLADCFMALGELDKAEETLLRMIEPRIGDQLGLVEPSAGEYRDALFKLGDIYVRIAEHERAIARYEEVLERYPEDSRINEVIYLLAEAYRKSAARISVDLEQPDNVAYRDDLRLKHRQRLQRARELYGDAIHRYEEVPPQSLSDLARLYLKLSHFQRADVAFDRSLTLDPSDMSPYAEALEAYDRAAWAYQDDPMAMAAYVQMMACHLRMGNLDKARMTLQRARWALKGIPDDAFMQFSPPEERRGFWEDYLAWLERTPTFKTLVPAAGGEGAG